MNYIAFFSFVFFTSITPGPNNIAAMMYSSKYGFRKGVLFVFGCLIGFLCLMLCCAVFSSILYETIPAIKPFFLTGGALYMLYLAWIVLKNKPHSEKDSIKGTHIVLHGALQQFINIKVIIYAITVWSTFILPHYNTFAALAGWYIFLSCFGPICSILLGSSRHFIRQTARQVRYRDQYYYGARLSILCRSHGAGYLPLSGNSQIKLHFSKIT